MISFCDLRPAIVPLRADIDAAISRVIDSGCFLRGPETSTFEEEWADYCGQRYAVCCNSGTDAITLAAMVLGLRHATIQANTLPLTGLGLHRADLEVRLADVGMDGHMLNPGPDAVPVLFYGCLPSAAENAARLFDAAHAHGWRPPSHATAAWSFYPTKTLGGFGDGGAITTNDAALAEEMRKLCGRNDQLQDRRQLTSRMDEIQAAVLRVKLRHLDEWLEQRRELADRYAYWLSPLGLTLPEPSLHHLYVIRTARRDALLRFLETQQIHCKIHWPQGLHRLPGPWTASGEFPNTDAWCDQILSLPCFPGLALQAVDEVCQKILEWTEAKSDQKVTTQVSIK
jgi:dTDP-4-amino-4,6-dideoxygalactose transaminase